jgi:hypothetical protein
MVTHLAQYLARSPRYILQPHDNTLIRVAGPHQIPWEEGTEIHNVSLSGLAFTAPADLCPMIGETIKIQFEAPGRQEMACAALVVRLQKSGRSTMLVAVKFIRLEMAQRLLLAQALAKKLKEQTEQQARQTRAAWWEGRRSRLVLAAALAGLWLFLLNWFWSRS